MKKIKTIQFICTTVVFITLLLSMSVYAQHRGDLLSFQGLDLDNIYGVRALAMGGAFTAVNGELDALYFNPAGLSGINKFQFSVNAFQYKKIWRERQDYRPNRQLVTLSFILDGLYTPNPDYNGWIDHEAFLDDSTYIVDDPEMGVDPYSEEGADWQNEEEAFEMYHVTAAMPFELMGKSFVAAAGYLGNVPIMNYDRNQTSLSPHIAWDGYGDMPDRVTAEGDSVRINWTDYERQRTGPLTQITGGLSVQLNNYLSLGLAVNHQSSDVDEFMSHNSIGHFDLVDGYNTFRFGYDTLEVKTSGTSTFSALKFDIGAQFVFNNLSVGLRVTPAYTMKREYKHTTETISNDGISSVETSGEDEMKIPLNFAAGISFKPISKIRVSLDLDSKSYSQSEFTFSSPDSTHRDWVDQLTYRFGVEYRPVEMISLMAGYQNRPEVFIPDGNGVNDRGPEAEIYSAGLSVYALKGCFSLAYQTRTLKYYDAYFSNTNWAYEKLTTWMFGYTIKL